MKDFQSAWAEICVQVHCGECEVLWMNAALLRGAVHRSSGFCWLEGMDEVGKRKQLQLEEQN